MNTNPIARSITAKTILGIDPGTRFIGIAVIRNGSLVHYQVRSFQGVWSDGKLKKILAWLNATMQHYHISKVAIKVPDVFPLADAYNRLIGALNVFLENKRVVPAYYSFSEMTARHCKDGAKSRIELMNAVIRKYPELMPEYRREQENKNAHYYKLFQAVAVAHMH